MEHLVLWALTTLVSAFIGSYLGAYLKKKGENLATHEDVNKLVQQVQAVTSATRPRFQMRFGTGKSGGK